MKPSQLGYVHGQPPYIGLQTRERYLPTAFDDSLSIIEKINKVIQYLHEYSQITTDMLSKWNEVYHWVMNEGLDETIGYRLMELVENGTIERIINQEILGELNDKVSQSIEAINKAIIELEVTTNFMRQEYYKLGTTTFEWR